MPQQKTINRDGVRRILTRVHDWVNNVSWHHVDALPTPSSEYDGQWYVITHGMNEYRYVCTKVNGEYVWSAVSKDSIALDDMTLGSFDTTQP